MHIDGGHLIELLIAAITFFGITWGFHREDKRRQSEQHEENRETLVSIKTQLQYMPPHNHGERSGPLTVEGIIYKPRNGR